MKGYAPTRVVCRELSPAPARLCSLALWLLRFACRELSSALARLCSLALWLLRFAKTILNRFFLLPLASRVVSYRLRLLGSAHSRFGSFASQKRYSIVFARSPLPNNRRGRVQIPFSISKKTRQTQGLSCFFWRRRRDLNSRAGYIRPTPLAGAPLRPT